MIAIERDSRDDDLRDGFAALRREEEAQAPQFAVFSPGDRRWPARKFIAFAACVVTIAAAVFLLRPVPPKPAPERGRPLASLTEWRARTDFLLDTPGRELLRTVPAIGVWHDYTRTPELKTNHPQRGKQALP